MEAISTLSRIGRQVGNRAGKVGNELGAVAPSRPLGERFDEVPNKVFDEILDFGDHLLDEGGNRDQS